MKKISMEDLLVMASKMSGKSVKEISGAKELGDIFETEAQCEAFILALSKKTGRPELRAVALEKMRIGVLKRELYSV